MKLHQKIAQTVWAYNNCVREHHPLAIRHLATISGFEKKLPSGELANLRINTIKSDKERVFIFGFHRKINGGWDHFEATINSSDELQIDSKSEFHVKFYESLRFTLNEDV